MAKAALHDQSSGFISKPIFTKQALCPPVWRAFRAKAEVLATRDKWLEIDDWNDRPAARPGRDREAGSNHDHERLEQDDRTISNNRRSPTRDGEIGRDADDADDDDPEYRRARDQGGSEQEAPKILSMWTDSALRPWVMKEMRVIFD